MKQYSLMETAYLLGVTTENLRYWCRCGAIPKPHQLHGKPHYNTKEVSAIRRQMTRGLLTHDQDGHSYYDVAKLARVLGVSVYSLQKKVARGDIPKPTHGTLRKYYRDDEIPQIKDALKQERKSNQWHKDMRERGYYNKTTAAEYLDMPYITFSVYLKRGTIPQPTHKENYLLWYTAEDLDRIKANELKDYFEERGSR